MLREPRSIESPAVTVSTHFHPPSGPDRGGVYFGWGWGALSEQLVVTAVNFILDIDLPLPPSAVEILRKERAA